MSIAGTSASSPLMASIYAIITSNLKYTHNNNTYGQLNLQLYAANENENLQKKVFKPIKSYNKSNDNNGATEDASEIVEYSWNLAKSRLSGSNGDGHGFDCVVGLGSIDGTQLQNYIGCAHTSVPTTAIAQFSINATEKKKITLSSTMISNNKLTIKYSNPLDKPEKYYTCNKINGTCELDASSTQNHTTCSSTCNAQLYKCNTDTGVCEESDSGDLLTNCSKSCTKQLYKCVNGTCEPSNSKSAQSKNKCESSCSETPPTPKKYKCNSSTGHCEETTDNDGVLEEDCNCSVTPLMYSCQNGKCISDSNGTKTLCECNNTCNEQIEPTKPTEPIEPTEPTKPTEPTETTKQIFACCLNNDCNNCTKTLNGSWCDNETNCATCGKWCNQE